MHAAAVADELSHGRAVTHIHAHFAHGTTTVTWWAAHLLDLPFSFTGHAKDIYQESLRTRTACWPARCSAATFVVTCTDANVDHLEALGTGSPVHLVYHGLNADFARLLADAPTVDRPDGLRIISVGRMVDKKGFDVLVEAVALLRDRGVESELVIAGEDGRPRAGDRDA